MSWFKSINPVYRNECAQHTKALRSSMAFIPMVGDPPFPDSLAMSMRRGRFNPNREHYYRRATVYSLSARQA